MKTRFNTYDLVCEVTELQKLIGLRVGNIYDINNKTYLIKLQKTEEKCILLLESGSRFHTTRFEWPKNNAPSGFSMKMRKHLKNKRLESLKQLGSDRIIDLQFGINEAAYHIIVELYDRGNVILTDHEMIILYVLRPHIEGEEVKFAIREKYPVDRARKTTELVRDDIREVLEKAKKGDQLKKVLLPHLDYGPTVIEHVILEAGFTSTCKIGKDVDIERDLDKIMGALEQAEKLMENARCVESKGYIIQKQEEKLNPDLSKELYLSNQEFHPLLFKQHSSLLNKEFTTFDMAVDEFFSTLESQKFDMKVIQQEKEAMKKLENVRKDHDQRLEALEKNQEIDKQKAELITRNQEFVDAAILAVQNAVASQMSWPDIQSLVKIAQDRNDPVASCIKQLKLEMNHITLQLSDPYDTSDGEHDRTEQKLETMLIDVDLALTAFANARKYYDKKRSAAKKQQKTMESQGKALKSAEKKTKETLKAVQIMTNINKARKVYWFEKFFWFITSENYLVIGGRDQQQNELIVKRYMKPNDIYVHADIHGASSVVVKNPTNQPIPPKTLNEAGTMAICYSVAWEARVVTSAWWVNANQVSKTAPTGEYLTTGSFMVRGKKNYLPPCHLIMGLGFLFKLEDGSLFRHLDERKVRGAEDEANVVIDEKPEEEVDLELIDDGEDDEEKEPDEQQKVEEDVKSDSDSESDQEKSHFPDTHIKIEHFSGTKINVLIESSHTLKEGDVKDTEEVVYLGDDIPVPVHSSESRRTSESKNKTIKKEPNLNSQNKTEDSKQHFQTKRGQKGKLKKIKEKYKDQDEEERRLRMAILQSSGKGKDSKKVTKKRQEQTIQENRAKKELQRAPKPVIKKEDDGDEDTEEIQVATDVDMLGALTGIPVTEDEILFCVPVVAPYNSLVNYKYKVKLTPGVGRRGKVAKTALNMFMKDKVSSQREKDLMRSVRDENLARNIPGKVKMSAPKLQALKK